MKRYLVHPLDFDSRAFFLEEPDEQWAEEVKELHFENRKNIINALKVELGEHAFEAKLKNFIDASSAPFSIISYHNSLYHQARYAFIHGFYYPSLTAACALGERILNHLIIDLREHYKNSPHYKNIYRKSSFDDWERIIEILEDWSVFQYPIVAEEFQKLKTLRNQVIHFNPVTYSTLREDTLTALKTLASIISIQFGFARDQKWMIMGTKGAVFTKKESESDPFIRRYYLPQCPKVGPYYSMRPDGKGNWFVIDWND